MKWHLDRPQCTANRRGELYLIVRFMYAKFNRVRPSRRGTAAPSTTREGEKVKGVKRHRMIRNSLARMGKKKIYFQTKREEAK